MKIYELIDRLRVQDDNADLFLYDQGNSVVLRAEYGDVRHNVTIATWLTSTQYSEVTYER